MKHLLILLSGLSLTGCAVGSAVSGVSVQSYEALHLSDKGKLEVSEFVKKELMLEEISNSEVR